MEYPLIYLAIDNCFASKRWTKPTEWMKVIKDLGVNYVEASADNECDPLYTTEEYLKDWVDEIKECSLNTGVKISSLYSGHGTYATLGLAHTYIRIRDRFLNQWLKAMAKVSVKLDAGLGFFCHAFSDSIFQNSNAYMSAKEDLYGRLTELSVYAYEQGLKYAGVEQMYSPHQIPWTIKGSEELLKQVSQMGKAFYITIDTGHQTGQGRFLKPDNDKLRAYLRRYRNEGHFAGMWLGPESAYEIFMTALGSTGSEEDTKIEKIQQEMERYPYFFAEPEDSNPYIWLDKLGCYSPIIHLQQTNGKSSSHQPFTRECNETGIITGEKLLDALYNSYSREPQAGLPPRCDKIYLTLEIFSGTADIKQDILYRLKESVKYWRRYIPSDGLRLDELVKKV